MNKLIFFPMKQKTPMLKWKSLNYPLVTAKSFQERGQTNVGIRNDINNQLSCLDIDNLDFAKLAYDRLVGFGPLVKTPKGGLHFYFNLNGIKKSLFNVKHYYINEIRSGEIRLHDSLQLFPNKILKVDLNDSLIYEPQNFNDLMDFNRNLHFLTISDIFNLLPEISIIIPIRPSNLKNISTLVDTLKDKEQDPIKNKITRHTTPEELMCDTFSYGTGRNHTYIFKLVKFIYKNCIWNDRYLIFNQWLDRHPYKKYKNTEYLKEFEDACNNYDNRKSGVKRKGFKQLYKEGLEKVTEFRSKQDKVNQIIEYMCLELGKCGLSFFFGCHSLKGIDSKEVSRALELMQKKGILEQTKASPGWTPDLKLFAAEYRLL